MPWVRNIARLGAVQKFWFLKFTLCTETRSQGKTQHRGNSKKGWRFSGVSMTLSRRMGPGHGFTFLVLEFRGRVVGCVEDCG